jgi:hypothetical protein
VRLDVTGRALTTGCGVGELQAFGVPAGLRDRGEGLGIDGRTGAAPHRWHRHRAQRLDPAPQPGRHHLHDLGERADRGVLDADDRTLGGRLQAHGEGHCLLVVDDERGQCGARCELVPAVDAAVGLHRVTQLAQPVDVAAQRAHGDLEPFRQVGAWPVPMGLQQRQQPQRPGARVRHATQSPAIQVRK